MDPKTPPIFLVIFLIISSILCSQSRAGGSGSVYFLDSSTHNYFQSRSSELNEVLLPNPFIRPHAVFLLEINGFGDKQPELGSDGDVFSKAFNSEIAFEDADIQLSDADELSLISLNEPLPADTEFTDTDLTKFASWFGGSYVINEVESLSGELTIPLENDELKLDMSKKADRNFITSIISLIHNIERAIQAHEDLVGSVPNPAELLNGRFDGFKAFQEQYGTDVVQKGAKLLVTAISKIYGSLQTKYKGKIVGIVVFANSPAEEMLNIKLTPRASPRWLEEEKEASGDAARILIAEVLLVRRTLAWITGIIFIIATLMGVWFLMYMPLTRDTLLYSNVKLD
ncbi:hypothetical protein M8C21_031616 [Ambrosia artemisiifolia]|uniref:DUF7794 domain-containing protein n=1 Tax=Ambrosia artemisiifolia TaxID=4212 RepID=A0AAD5CDL6_AMBAR|nr:hypothetical protein M8C21_031616 [Ambrosia artemisiifolia]